MPRKPSTGGAPAPLPICRPPSTARVYVGGVTVELRPTVKVGTITYTHVQFRSKPIDQTLLRIPPRGDDELVDLFIHGGDRPAVESYYERETCRKLQIKLDKQVKTITAKNKDTKGPLGVDYGVIKIQKYFVAYVEEQPLML